MKKCKKIENFLRSTENKNKDIFRKKKRKIEKDTEIERKRNAEKQ